jgi:hypothetical protein
MRGEDEDTINVSAAAFMRLACRVIRRAVLRLGSAATLAYQGALASFWLPALASWLSRLKPWARKHAEARFGRLVTTEPGRQTAGLVTLWESPMNRA